MRRGVWIVLLIAAALVSSAVLAQAQTPQTVPLRTALEGLLAEADAQCPRMAAALDAERSALDPQNLWIRTAYQRSLCQCQPAKVKAVLAERAQAQLAAQVSMAQALEFTRTAVTAPCLGDMFRELFGGQQCRKLTTTAVCDCMAPELSRLTDVQIMEAGIAFQQYRAAADSARAAASAAPDPGAAAPLVTLLRRCSSGRG